jgi:hypothetical protein
LKLTFFFRAAVHAIQRQDNSGMGVPQYSDAAYPSGAAPPDIPTVDRLMRRMVTLPYHGFEIPEITGL